MAEPWSPLPGLQWGAGTLFLQQEQEEERSLGPHSLPRWGGGGRKGSCQPQFSRSPREVCTGHHAELRVLSQGGPGSASATALS